MAGTVEPWRCAVARVTTEELLREVLGMEDVHDSFSGCVNCRSWSRGPMACFRTTWLAMPSRPICVARSRQL